MTMRLLWITLLFATGCRPASPDYREQRVSVESGGWQIVGDLVLPSVTAPVPAVLALNQAAGNRTAYAALARSLAERGVASLRIDLRAHGESSNLGTFTPGVPGAPGWPQLQPRFLAARCRRPRATARRTLRRALT